LLIDDRRIFRISQNLEATDLSTPRPEFDFPGLKAGDSGVFVQRDGKKHMSTGMLLKYI
jgi:uncharacterized protein (DUF2237 family)